MAAYFFDSSAIVKRYVSESGTQWVTDKLEPTAGNEVYAARISGAEVVSTIARRAREANFSWLLSVPFTRPAERSVRLSKAVAEPILLQMSY